MEVVRILMVILAIYATKEFMKHILLTIFIARVLIPLNPKVYDNVLVWSIFHDTSYRLCLANGTVVIVPAMWTIIEEKK